MNSPKSTKRPKPTEGTTVLSHAAVVETIRQAILTDHLIPGQRLVEAELCQLLGASRGTVRAALMDLVHEGLVERIANKGARVRVIGLQEALNLVEVRMEVEGLCVARAAERITDEGIRTLKDLAKKLKESAKASDVGRFADLTHELFEIYVRIADQPVAKEVLERLRALNARHRFRLSHRPGRAQVALPYWLDLIEAICSRDSEAARRALQRHAKNVQETMKEVAHLDRTPFAIVNSGEGAQRDS